MMIQPFTPNMDISRTVLEGRWGNSFIDTTQKVAIYSVIPIALIIFVEAVLKNMLFINLTNATISLINVSSGFNRSLRGYALERFGY